MLMMLTTAETYLYSVNSTRVVTYAVILLLRLLTHLSDNCKVKICSIAIFSTYNNMHLLLIHRMLSCVVHSKF